MVVPTILNSFARKTLNEFKSSLAQSCNRTGVIHLTTLGYQKAAVLTDDDFLVTPGGIEPNAEWDT